MTRKAKLLRTLIITEICGCVSNRGGQSSDEKKRRRRRMRRRGRKRRKRPQATH